RDWLHREASSLDEAQRLQLDDHLASCAQCRGDRERMQTLHRAGTSLDAPAADARLYDRAIARALLEGPRVAEPVRARWLVPVVLAALAATALAAVIAVRGGSNKAATPTSAAPHIETSASPREAAAPTTDEARRPGPASDEASTGAGAPTTDEASTTDKASTSDKAPTSDEALEMPIDRVGAPRKPGRTAPKPETVEESIADVLARARTLLAAHDYASAERTAASVLPRARGADEAEARTILADIAQASGQLDLAHTRYVEVATKFASLSAGESALYAAARLALRRGHDARPLLEQYLARYPRGRFVVDARRLLGSLPKEQR
ncbi:MAG: hypothetical protein AB7T06_48130, partial [Kofleriaceae bacterium]